MICFLYFIELKIVTLSLQAAYCVYCAAVQIGLKTLVPFMIWSASCLSLCAVGSSSQAAASSRGPASVRVCVCVCVCVCVWRGWSLLIAQHVLAFASSWMCAERCFCLYVECISQCVTADVAVIIHHVLSKTVTFLHKSTAWQRRKEEKRKAGL